MTGDTTMRQKNSDENTVKFACDGITDDSAALSALVRRALGGESVGRQRNENPPIAQINSVADDKAL
jgi:hypothetical protein